MTTRPAIHLDRIDFVSAVRRSVEPDAVGADPDVLEAFAVRCAALLREQVGMVEEGARPLEALAACLVAHVNHEVDVCFRDWATAYERSRLRHNLAGMIHGAAAVYASSCSAGPLSE